MSKKTKRSDADATSKEILRKLDMMLIIHLAKAGFSLKETADVLKVSEDTVERMLPFKKLKSKMQEG